MQDALKKQLIDLIKNWQKEWTELRGGKKITIEEIASQMDFTRVHLTRLMGPDYKIDEKTLKYATNAYKLWKAELFVENLKQNVPHGTKKGTRNSESDLENQQSLERSLEMALSIADRVTVMLEKKYGTSKTIEIGNQVKEGGIAAGGHGEPGTVTNVPKKKNG